MQKTLHKLQVFYKIEKEVLYSAPQNERLNFSFVKDIHVVGKKMASKGRETAIYQSQNLGITF